MIDTKEDKSNIILIGMPGAGKSTIGVLLAKALGMAFVDTDILIQKSQGCLLQDIINENGIESFLKIEERVLTQHHFEGTVIATGGSVVYSQQIMKHYKTSGIIVYLYIPYEEIKRRLGNMASRGVAIKTGYSLSDLYQEREPLYRYFNDEIVDCSNLDVERCVDKIMKIVKA